MGSCNSKEAEVSAKQKKLNDDQKKLNDDLARIEALADAETIQLDINGPGGKFDHDARLNGTLQELTEKVALKLGLTNECAKDVEMHLSGYKLEPVTKIVREFTELCAGSEIHLVGIEKAKEAMKKQEAMKPQQAATLNVHEAARTGNLAQLNIVVEFAPERINETEYKSHNGHRLQLRPLHCAAQCGQEAAVSLLLSAKADVNETSGTNSAAQWPPRFTPFAMARPGGRVKQLLREAGGHF